MHACTYKCHTSTSQYTLRIHNRVRTQVRAVLTFRMPHTDMCIVSSQYSRHGCIVSVLDTFVDAVCTYICMPHTYMCIRISQSSQHAYIVSMSDTSLDVAGMRGRDQHFASSPTRHSRPRAGSRCRVHPHMHAASSRRTDATAGSGGSRAIGSCCAAGPVVCSHVGITIFVCALSCMFARCSSVG